MRFKGKINLGTMEIPKTETTPDVKLNNVEVEYEIEYNLAEATGMYGLFKQAVQELPETLEDLKTGVLKFMELENEFHPVNVEEGESSDNN